jgi:hypothetical protein
MSPHVRERTFRRSPLEGECKGMLIHADLPDPRLLFTWEEYDMIILKPVIEVPVSGHKSKRKTSKPRFYAFSTNHPTLMKLPGAPRKPLGEVSPNQRSRVVGSRDHGIPFPVIARMESLTDTTCRSIVKNASH